MITGYKQVVKSFFFFKLKYINICSVLFRFRLCMRAFCLDMSPTTFPGGPALILFQTDKPYLASSSFMFAGIFSLPLYILNTMLKCVALHMDANTRRPHKRAQPSLT